MTNDVKELRTEADIRSAFPVMNELRTHLDEVEYHKLVIDAMENDGYRLFGLYVNEEIMAVAGFKPMITLYYGRFVWVCDLVTSRRSHSQGIGEKLLNFVEEWAKEHGYTSVALSSGLSRTDAHRFYEDKMNYDQVSYVFKKNVSI